MEEYQAVALLKRGNMEGLEMLVRRYYHQAVRASYLIVQDRDQAEDIVQNSFLHANEKICQLRSERFGPWFLKSVINASIKVAKQQKRLVSIEEQEDAKGLLLAEWLLDKRPMVEEVVETEEFRQEIREAIRRLTPDQRAAIVLKYFLEYSEPEITRQLKKPLSSIKWYLHSAREKLKELLDLHRFH